MTSGVVPSTEREAGQLDTDVLVALPEPNLSMTQDAEWCVVQVDGEWRQIRFHDYDELFSVPGLYEKVLYEILRCDSPRVVRGLLEDALADTETPPSTLRVLDLGAGNGMVGEELADLGAGLIVGADIIEEAATATERDRPGLYDDYCVVDMTALDEEQRDALAAHRFNALVCVAALGFGDIPVEAFVSAYNLVEPGGWIAFNIKEDFLTNGDASGFARLVQTMSANGTMELRQRQRYQHRLATDRRPLHYVALVGTKRRDIKAEMLKRVKR